MKKPRINVIITKEETGYSASTTVGNDFIGTQGDTYEELKSSILEAVNLAVEEKDINYAVEEIHYTLDLPSFFSFYKVLTAKALSERIGMNQSL
jgi:hypothetical protein